MYSAAQHVAHVAQTIEWFVEGASRREGFDLDFEKHLKQLECVTSLSATRTMLSDWYAAAVKYFGGQSEQELDRPLPEGPVMGGMSIWQVVGAIAEHTVHHRGALTVYSRLLGKVPPMPYGEM